MFRVIFVVWYLWSSSFCKERNTSLQSCLPGLNKTNSSNYLCMSACCWLTASLIWAVFGILPWICCRPLSFVFAREEWFPWHRVWHLLWDTKYPNTPFLKHSGKTFWIKKFLTRVSVRGLRCIFHFTEGWYCTICFHGYEVVQGVVYIPTPQ